MAAVGKSQVELETGVKSVQRTCKVFGSDAHRVRYGNYVGAISHLPQQGAQNVRGGRVRRFVPGTSKASRDLQSEVRYGISATSKVESFHDKRILRADDQ